MKIVYSGVMSGKNGFTDALRKVFDEVQDVPKEQLINIDSADIVFLQPQDTGISREALQHLKSIGAYVINWTGDARDTTPKYCFEYAPYVDITAFTNMRDVENMRNFGFNSTFLQIGADPEIYYPDPTIEKDIDIVFMGNNYGHFPLSGLRKQMVAELKRVYGDRFKAYGIGQPDGNLMGNQKGEADIYRRAKIGINLSHYDLPRYTSDRIFRMLLSGIHVMCKEFPDRGVDTYISGGHLVCWNDLKDLIQKIRYSLSDDYYRTGIAEGGYKLGKEYYTFEKMAQRIKSLYERNKPNA